MTRRRRRALGQAFTYLALVLIMIFVVGPIIWIAITSLQPMSNLMSVPLKVSFSNVTFEYYRSLFADRNFVKSVINTVVTTVVSTVLVLAVSSLGAYAVARFRFANKELLLFSILGIQLGPAVAYLIPLFIMVRWLGLIDTWIGLILVFLAFVVPIGIWLLRGFFEDIPRELEPAARMDGCSRFGAFSRIILPLARGGIMATAIFVFISIWGDFLIPLIVTFSHSITLTVFASAFSGTYDVNYGGAAATAVISGLPTILLAIIFRRHLIRGLTEGSVKR